MLGTVLPERDDFDGHISSYHLMIDLETSASRLATVLATVRDDQLDLPSPSRDLTTGDLIDHIGAFSRAFVHVARKEVVMPGLAGPPPPPSAQHLEPGWRDRIAGDLTTLVEAWRDPAAWTGMTKAGGIDLPGEVAGLVAIDELVVHGWDVAVATGQPYEVSDEEVEATMAFVREVGPTPDRSLFGPAVPVKDDAPPLHRLLGLTGRDPAWRPPAN